MTPECKKTRNRNSGRVGEKKRRGVMSQEEVRQGRGQGSGAGMVQSSTPSCLSFFFFFFPSLTHHTIRHCLFSDWEMQGHQKAAKRISEPLEAQTHTEGMSATPKYMLQFTTRGWKEENLDRVDLKKKNKIKPKLHRRQCVMLYARLLCK